MIRLFIANTSVWIEFSKKIAFVNRHTHERKDADIEQPMLRKNRNIMATDEAEVSATDKLHL